MADILIGFIIGFPVGFLVRAWLFKPDDWRPW